MISFAAFTPEDGVPIYLQIVRHVKRGIVAGAIRGGDELPSRRALSSLLGVNPNTVQKAYRLLEEEGIISSHAGAKSEVSPSADMAASIRAELLAQEAAAAVRAMRQMAIPREQALALIDRLWREAEQEVER